VSFDPILGRSPSIIYRPGGVAGGLVVTTWTEVQNFIAVRQGAVIVYVDDSITSPAPVPAASGVTACDGRVELRAYAIDGTTFAILEIEDGATLQDLYAVRAMELRCNCQTTPSLTWTITPTGGDLNLFDFAALSNASTATIPAISVPAGKQFFLLSDTSFFILNAPAVPLVAIPATAVFNLEVFDGTGVPSGLVSGAGTFSLVYDNASGSLFPTPGVPPTQPGFSGLYLPTNLDAIFPNPGPQAQATWFIDPANSTGNARDTNSGIDAAHPVLTYQFGVARKWTTYSPVLRQDTTLTWLSSQPAGNADPVIFNPIMVGAVATITAPLGAGQQIGSGSLASVTPKNRSTKQLLQADLGFAAPIGTIIQNTTGGKSSYAYVYANVSGTVFALTQPLVPATLPLSGTNIPSPANVDTWANGDTFVAYAPIGVNLVKVEPTIAEYESPDFPAQVQLAQLHVLSANGPAGSDVYIGSDVTPTLCSFDPVLVDTSSLNDEATFYYNCFVNNDAVSSTGSNNLNYFYGGALFSVTGSIVAWQFDFDAIIDAEVVANIDFARFFSENDSPTQGIFYLTGTLRLGGTQGFRSPDTASGLSGPWGPGTLDVVGMSRIYYNAATAVAIFGNIAALELNSQGSATAFDPTSGLWSALIPITAANLDLAYASGGFGGTAINVGGAAYTNQFGA